MNSLAAGWRIQVRVLGALMIRELNTRFGRENIGFLWMMVEPLLFALLVSGVWRITHGPMDHGINIMAFVVTGYIPMVMFRTSVNQSVGLFRANGSLMHHRQILIQDFVFVRFSIECVGHMMAYLFIGVILVFLKILPVPSDMGYFALGWTSYAYFVLSLCFILAPLSEMSDILEKFVPVTIYIMVPFSGSFSMESWLAPKLREGLLYSPQVSGMELMRYGLFGDQVIPYYSILYPFAVSSVFLAIGLILCRRVRRTLVVE